MSSMRNAPSTFDSYCSSSMLYAGQDLLTILEWKRRYFIFHYRQRLPVDRTAAIADIGCGFGPYLRTLRDLGYQNVRGVDLGTEQVALAREELGLGDIVECGDGIEWLEARVDTFDCLLVFDLLEHLAVDDLLRIGSAISGALKPGGTVIVQAPNGLSPLNPVRYGDFTHRRSYTVDSLRQFFRYAGLEPTAFLELAPVPHDILSTIQRLLWVALLAPAVRVFVRMLHGKVEGGIHTTNLAAVATRS